MEHAVTIERGVLKYLQATYGFNGALEQLKNILEDKGVFVDEDHGLGSVLVEGGIQYWSYRQRRDR